jgi:hypothetical protein
MNDDATLDITNQTWAPPKMLWQRQEAVFQFGGQSKGPEHPCSIMDVAGFRNFIVQFKGTYMCLPYPS